MGRFGTALGVALCTLLGVNLMVMAFGRSGGPTPASAQVAGYTNGGGHGGGPGVVPAPENTPSAPTTTVEMLKRVVEQLSYTNERLARIEERIGGTYNVNVTNWPAGGATK